MASKIRRGIAGKEYPQLLKMALENKLQPNCIAVHEPTGIHYCSQIRDIRITPVCAYQSVVPCRELGINRCMYSLELKVEK